MVKYWLAGWGELLKNSVASVRESVQTNADEIGRISQQTLNVRDFAELGKTFLEAGNELRMLNETILNNMVQWQIGMVDLKSLASAIRELDTIRTDAMTRLVRNQANLLNDGMENGASHLEILKRARGSSDLVATQMDFFSDFQAVLKKNTVELLGIMEAVVMATRVWNEKNIDNMIKGQTPLALP